MLFVPRQKPTFASRLQTIMWPKRGLKRAWIYLWHRVSRISATPHIIALGFAAGAFASFTPFVGFHFIIAAIIALAIGGSVLASALGTSVGNPLTFPFIWLATYQAGNYILRREPSHDVNLYLPDGTMLLLFQDPAEFWRIMWEAIGPVLVPMLVGCVPVGLVVAAVLYFLVRPAVRGYQARRRARLARQISRQGS